MLRAALSMPQCPFHGKIIPRDDAGRPLDPEDRAREQRQQLQRQAERPGRSLRGPATPSLVVLGVHCLRGSQHARASGGASSCSSCCQLAGRVWFPGDVSAGLGRRVGARCPHSALSGSSSGPPVFWPVGFSHLSRSQDRPGACLMVWVTVCAGACRRLAMCRVAVPAGRMWARAEWPGPGGRVHGAVLAGRSLPRVSAVTRGPFPFVRRDT